MPLSLNVGDILTMKKKHPCGSSQWEILRTGADLRLRCLGCKRMVFLARSAVEKSIVHIEPAQEKKE